jgi:arylsulfatase A-like enzyme
MIDDMGYGDLGCHGSPFIETPHIDVSAPRTAGARSLAERVADFQANPQGWQRVSASAEQATARAAGRREQRECLSQSHDG